MVAILSEFAVLVAIGIVDLIMSANELIKYSDVVMGIFIIFEVSEKSPYGDYIGAFIKVTISEAITINCMRE